METGHFPNKHDRRLNWYKYNAKLIKQGKLSAERERLIHELENMRSGEHTGGRRKKNAAPPIPGRAAQTEKITGIRNKL